MKTMSVRPALCCSTGVCGVEVDQALLRFAADVDRPERRARESSHRIRLFRSIPIERIDRLSLQSQLREPGQ